MNLKCVKETEGFTVGKDYKLLGAVAEYVELKDDRGKKVTVYESNFEFTQ